MIPQDELNKLVPASTAKQTAENALSDLQIQSVAYNINQAANTGEYSVQVNGPLYPATMSELESKGYILQNIGIAKRSDAVKISWKG